VIQEGRFEIAGAQRRDPWRKDGWWTTPVVAAVQGWVMTLAIELLLAADIRIAAENARFSQMEIKRGIYAFGGATVRLPREAGWGNAMRWLLTGDEFTAAEAHRIGLVQEVVPLGQHIDRAISIAETIARQAPLGVAATLASARRALNEEAAARALLPEVQRLMNSEDAREGMMSFLERRAAKFTGK